ncbi:MAG: hypothetical protein COB67_07070 [SAR324 cluster bacterium]|uniref:Uncharacterized protein n=1 Tax=SAR324 cluster bacterium TaxID=2024889 RepID=A0A2A4T3I9_9DELT|nr:MAG: hypothetical protein COB67_07070 [SAR324 cluster bacterium]
MNIKRGGKLALILLVSCMLSSNLILAQPSKSTGNIRNLYTTWVKLALLGKNQAEIEFFFRNIDGMSLGRIKERLRFAVLDNLRRSGLKTMIQKSSDVDDFNAVVRKIITEIRYMGMEHDPDLKLSIKEEFGVVLERL